MGVWRGPVIAVFHDVLITLGLFSVFHYEISLTGYRRSAHTRWIFDERYDRDLRSGAGEFAPDAAGTTSGDRESAIKQTLSRTVLTSGLTFLTVLVLYLMGGEVLRSFSFAMVVGVVIGTYSSFGIAAPIVVAWHKFYPNAGVAGATPGKNLATARR